MLLWNAHDDRCAFDIAASDIISEDVIVNIDSLAFHEDEVSGIVDYGEGVSKGIGEISIESVLLDDDRIC